MSTVVITHRGEERVRSGHPWIYKSDVAKVDAQGGDTVRVVGTRGRTVGHALYSDRSEISLRLLTRGAQAPDLTLWRSRLRQAIPTKPAARERPCDDQPQNPASQCFQPNEPCECVP